jgi:transcriptional regulator with GAF, ATPase, and Fis domain/predicted negative regulator of RcsB-dependent stress response
MDLTSELLQQIGNPELDHNERVLLRCKLAKELEEAGNYEAAREIMGNLWRRIGEYPNLDGLDERTAAEVLMRAGALTGWIGSVNQVAGAQEQAKDLLSKSITLFETLPDIAKTAEAQTELAYCYWREGAFDEARITLREALSRISNTDSELKAVTLLRSAIVERTANRLNDALHILTDAAPLFKTSDKHGLRGRFHNELATTLKNLGTTEKREDYIDRALVDYAAASFHFEQAGHTRYRARVENNLGFLFLRLAKFDESNEHLDCARRLFVSLKDNGSVAQVDETRARALVAQGRNAEAEKVVRSAVWTLEKGGEQALLAEALTTYGLALARLEQHEQARLMLERAMEVAEQAGDLEGAGRAALTLIEELKGLLSEDELRGVYSRADGLLARTQHSETMARLRECARQVIEARQAREATEVENFVYVAEGTASLLRQAQRMALTNGTVLLTGETGTGKEVLARLIHEWSGRAGRFVAINCAGLNDTLIESQLFGHKKGGFTDAIHDYPGAVREAAGGTLLLDEVGDLSKTNQGKLLRLIERGEIHPIGATAPEQINVRIIAATKHDIKEQVAQGNFRDDLFYRLQTFHLNIPPLRERAEDIPAIAAYFIEDARARHHKRVTFTPASLEAMRRLPLKGNVRELRALIERTFLEARDGAQISAEAVELLVLRQTQKAGLANAWEGCSLVEEVSFYEKTLIRRALEATQGGVTRAARLLGTTHQALIAILSTRHQDLLSARKPAQPRRKSIIKIHDNGSRKKRKSVKAGE